MSENHELLSQVESMIPILAQAPDAQQARLLIDLDRQMSTAEHPFAAYHELAGFLENLTDETGDDAQENLVWMHLAVSLLELFEFETNAQTVHLETLSGIDAHLEFFGFKSLYYSIVFHPFDPQMCRRAANAMVNYLTRNHSRPGAVCYALCAFSGRAEHAFEPCLASIALKQYNAVDEFLEEAENIADDKLAGDILDAFDRAMENYPL